MLTRINIAAFLLLSAVILFPATSFSQSYYQSGGNATKSNQTCTAASADKSGVLVTNAGVLTLSNSKVTTSGNTTSNDSSSFYGLNAGVLAQSASTITLLNCTVNTTGTGANGVFSTGSGTSVALSGDTVICTNDGAHGVDATMGAAMTLTNVFISTAGAHGAAISTDRGGGTVTVSGGSAAASGQDSPGIYCTGTIIVSDATVSGTGAEAAVIEGANSITLTNTTLSGAKGTRNRGLVIYQSMSGDAQGTEGVFTMKGGTYVWPSTSGPAFYVTNSTGVITLDSLEVVNNSDTLIKAGADQWGTTGANGGTVIFTASGDTLTGAIVCDDISSATLTLHTASRLTGRVFNTCLGFLKSRDEADDAAQEVFVEVLDSIGEFRGESKLSTWIYRITVNKCLQELRRKNRRKKLAMFIPLLVEKGSDDAPGERDRSNEPPAQFDDLERAGILYDALEKLPESQRVAITLLKIEGLSYDEISEVMNTSISSVESLVHRARANLKKRLYNYYRNHL